MGVIDLIDKSSIIALDTNIYIFALEDPGFLGRKTRILLEHIKKVQPKVIISILILEEFFVKVYQQQKEKNTDEIINFISMGGLVALTDVNQKIALGAAKIRAQYKSIKTPDAIHLASAIESGAKVFVTTDKRLPKKIGGLTIRPLDV